MRALGIGKAGADVDRYVQDGRLGEVAAHMRLM